MKMQGCCGKCTKWISAKTPPETDDSVWVWDGVQVSMDSFNLQDMHTGMIVVNRDGVQKLEPPTGWWHHYSDDQPHVICWTPIVEPEKPEGWTDEE